MALFSSTVEDQSIEEYQQREDEVVGSLCSLSGGPKVQMEQEKRIRREIANSNERRRMQSINAGFQSLRTLLPHHEGEKLSKAAILQQTAEYIYQLEQEKTRLLSQNCQLKRLVGQQHSPDSDGGSSIDSPLPKRKKIEDNSDEKKPVAPEKVDDASATMEELRKEMIELRVQLDRERRLRMMLEEQIRSMEAQLYPERIREITQQVQLQYQHPGQEEGDVSVKDEPQRTQTPTVVTLTPQQTAVFLQERIPSVLEAAIKAEPRVEVEAAPRVPSPASHVEYTASAVTTIDAVEDVVMTAAVSEPNTTIQVHQELQPAITTATTTTPGVSQSVQPTRVYIANTSRQNLETIVEAIRHLEGDHLFNDEPQRSGLVAPEPAQEIETQEVPLELTTHTAREAVSGDPTIVRVVEDVNMEEIQSAYTVEYSGASVPNRPGVIVVKRS